MVVFWAAGKDSCEVAMMVGTMVALLDIWSDIAAVLHWAGKMVSSLAVKSASGSASTQVAEMVVADTAGR